MKNLGLILLIAVLISVLPGCGVAITNINGRGSVETQYVFINGDVLHDTGQATFSLNFACYAQNNNRMQGYVNWYDPANGVRISAILPETSVKSIGIPGVTTCKALKAFAPGGDFYVAVGGIFSENGNADGDVGPMTGQVIMVVAKPGVPIDEDGPVNSYETVDCGADGTAVVIGVQTQNYNDNYEAGGCLDRGQIVFGSGGQNQQ